MSRYHSKFHCWFLLVRSFKFHNKVNEILDPNYSDKVSKFDGFDHKMPKFPSFITFLGFEIVLFSAVNVQA